MMNWAAKLTREDLLQDIEAFKDHADFPKYREYYLKKAVYDLDRELIVLLLKAGANPNITEPCREDLLAYLVHEYRVTNTTKGQFIHQIIELLLKFDADPNYVGSGNWRTVDRCIENNEKELVELFVSYGADRKQREYI